MPAHPRPLTVSCALASLVLVLAACGGDDENAAASGDVPTKSVNTAGAVMLNGEWPLTGERLQGDLPDHPVYVVKMDNTLSSAPQVGLGSADMIVEELVEGGLTRLAVFYYQKLPDNVGPVRSMRASDIGIVEPVSASLVASGAANKTIRRIAGADIQTLTEVEGVDGFARDDNRSAPYNLFMALANADTPDTWSPPTDPYLPFGDEGDFAGDITVRTVSAEFSPGHTTTWALTDDGWTRPDSFAEAGNDFTADNVLLLRVQVGDAGYLDPGGYSVPETKLVGKGQAVLVHGDKALTCVWSKQTEDSPLSLQTRAGKDVTVPPGHTWIELVPRDTGNVTLSK